MSHAADTTAVVFDFGRVLFDWQPEALLARVLPHRAQCADTAAHWVEQIFQAYGGDWGDFDRGTVDVPTLVARIAARTGLARSEVQAVVDAVPQALTPLPGTVAVLERLRAAGRRLFFLSNMPLPYAEHLERTHSFLGWFDGGVFSSRARLNKPDPAIFDHAQRQFGVAAADLLFIDDHAPNVEAAQALGWQAVQFTGDAALARDLGARGLLS
ncbi:HAD family phosphatase [Ideonella sp.]|uniref:HAD family hydrolase n=1 Tax=Ideonella sp. TaxID=1929293 RepID=UPI002B45D3DD|nr:HAD family phosphatase [Ideonella sp.]HJV68308.1 HAD family phosphatase [Ideonella sp.]